MNITMECLSNDFSGRRTIRNTYIIGDDDIRYYIHEYNKKIRSNEYE